MKKSLLNILAASVFFTGCLKDTANTDFSNVGTLAEISSGSTVSDNSPISGLDYFTKSTLPLFTSDEPDTITFNVNIASEFPPNKDVTVTVGIDDAKRTAYNALGKVQFKAQPDSTFTFPVTTATIKAGSRLATFKVVYYPAKIDPTESYMLPISITDASGIKISGNLSTVYFHIVGNPIAGTYAWHFERRNHADASGDPEGGSFDDVVTFVPVSPTTIAVPTGYYNQPNYLVSFTNTNGVLSDFHVVIDPDQIKPYFNDNGITLQDGPNILDANPTTGHYKFQYLVTNSSGARYLIDEYTK